MKIHIKHCHVIDPANGVDRPADVFVADGRIAGIGAAPDGFSADRVIDASGLVAVPGLVDLCARLREPGYEYKATLESEMKAAVHGGVTSLVCPPDTDPALDEPGLVEMLKFRAERLKQGHVFPQGALTLGLKGEVLTEMAELTDSGCIGFGQADVPITNTQVLLRAMQYANTFGYTVWLRPQDAWLGKGGVAHSGAVAARLGLAGVGVSAETIALHTIFELMRITGCRVHLCRISSANGVELLRAARAEGLPVTADVSLNHVHLTDVDIGFFDPMYRLEPPLRSGRDRAALRQALLDGTIDAICSDHCPVDDDEKLLPFDQASAGAIGLELLLPLALKWARESGLGDAAAIRLVTQRPAGIVGGPALAQGAGTLSVGALADICVYDPQAWWKVEPAAIASQGKNTPWLRKELQGEVAYTLVAGEVAYERAAVATA
ncbi:dihydroorotase [Derxia gummosa]|uniref:Dihydroorotase n=1 Tax=Derxia gummosa DSM 723 TaxID=1121388 RepID=A0A8B6X2W8_9BURK|nr:dihydroorotase [Derxia gummosa]